VYIIDALESHGGQFADNLGKAKGLALYAADKPGIGRVQLIREIKGLATGSSLSGWISPIR